MFSRNLSGLPHPGPSKINVLYRLGCVAMTGAVDLHISGKTVRGRSGLKVELYGFTRIRLGGTPSPGPGCGRYGKSPIEDGQARYVA